MYYVHYIRKKIVKALTDNDYIMDKQYVYINVILTIKFQIKIQIKEG